MLAVFPYRLLQYLLWGLLTVAMTTISVTGATNYKNDQGQTHVHVDILEIHDLYTTVKEEMKSKSVDARRSSVTCTSVCLSLWIKLHCIIGHSKQESCFKQDTFSSSHDIHLLF